MTLTQPASTGNDKAGSAPRIDGPAAGHLRPAASGPHHGGRREHSWPYDLVDYGSRARILAGIDAAGPASCGLTAAPLPADGDWRLNATCRSADPDLFFPISYTGASLQQVIAAKAVCARCPVERECLEFAQRTRQVHGIWGGLTELERRRAPTTGERRPTRSSPDANRFRLPR